MITKYKNFKKSSHPYYYYTILVLLLVGISFLIFSNLRIRQKRAELTTEIKSLEKEIQVLEKKNQDLKTKISQSHSPEYLEKVARTRLDLQKQGEHQVVVLPPEKETEKTKEKSFWNPKEWLEWIKNKVRE